MWLVYTASNTLTQLTRLIAEGFLTTFTMLARDRLSLKEMSWILVKVFFGYGGETPCPRLRLANRATQIGRSWTRKWFHRPHIFIDGG